MDNIIYFELNNWRPGVNYPDEEPFTSWLKDDLHIKFDDEEWVKENQLCAVSSLVDMSSNYCITTTRKWVEDNCPKLLTEFTIFLREPGKDGKVYGMFGHEFLEYEPENVGIKFVEF